VTISQVHILVLLLHKAVIHDDFCVVTLKPFPWTNGIDLLKLVRVGGIKKCDNLISSYSCFMTSSLIDAFTYTYTA
jgi:hypothetical protein